MQGISIRRSFPHLPPASVCLLSPFAAYTARRFLPAVFAPSRFPHVPLADPYMLFQPLPIFRMYNPPIPTCAFSLFPFSACTDRRFLPALSTASPLSACTASQFLPALSISSHFRTYGLLIPTCAFDFLPFPHVRLADPYMRLRSRHVFRMYCPSIPTCAFDLTLSSARTPRRFLPVLSTSPRLPHVHPADSYMRLRPRRVFRTYTPSIPTCTFGFLPLSARTAR